MKTITPASGEFLWWSYHVPFHSVQFFNQDVYIVISFREKYLVQKLYPDVDNRLFKLENVGNRVAKYLNYRMMVQFHAASQKDLFSGLVGCWDYRGEAKKIHLKDFLILESNSDPLRNFWDNHGTLSVGHHQFYAAFSSSKEAKNKFH